MSALETGLEVLTAGPKVRGLLWPLGLYADQAQELTEQHPDLAPEIEAANFHVGEAAAAIERAVDFLSAKLDAEGLK